MAKTDKPIPKSLHTITALCDVARLHMANGKRCDVAMREAMRTLGLHGRDDPHNLEATALRFLKARKD